MARSCFIACALWGMACVATAQLISDPGAAGPELELVHLYYDEFATGRQISRSCSALADSLQALRSRRRAAGSRTIRLDWIQTTRMMARMENIQLPSCSRAILRHHSRMRHLTTLLEARSTTLCFLLVCPTHAPTRMPQCT